MIQTSGHAWLLPIMEPAIQYLTFAYQHNLPSGLRDPWLSVSSKTGPLCVFWQSVLWPLWQKLAVLCAG